MVEPTLSPWNKALALIRANVTEQVYNTWFQKIVFESYNETTKTVLLQVPSPFVCEYVEENYVDLLGKALRDNFCPEVRLRYRVVTDQEHHWARPSRRSPKPMAPLADRHALAAWHSSPSLR